MYHTIVPCTWWWGDGLAGDDGSGDDICIDVWAESWLWLTFKPPNDEPNDVGFILLLLKGTPITGVASSGGVT